MKEEDTFKKRKRNDDIDIIKGFLVLIMIFFHCASLARDIYPDLRIVIKILNWLHYGFILMSGFLCGWYYSPKVKMGERSVKIRLQIRGIKLIVLFIIINVFLYSSQFMGAFNIDMLKQTVTSINTILNNYVLDMNGNLVGFQVVYYIGLFLLIVSLIIDRVRLVGVFLISIFVVIIAVYGKTFLFLSFGFIGYCLGLTFKNNLNSNFIKNKKIMTIVISILFLSYVTCIDFVRLPMVQVPLLKPIIFLFEMILWFLFAILTTQYINSNKFNTMIRYFSKYTLWGYIAQMLIIRVGFILISKMGISNWSYYFTNVLFTATILYISIRFLDFLRKKYRIADNGYRFVFQ